MRVSWLSISPEWSGIQNQDEDQILTRGYCGMNAKRASKFETILMAELCPLDVMIIFTCSPVLVTNCVTKQFSHGPTGLQVIPEPPLEKMMSPMNLV